MNHKTETEPKPGDLLGEVTLIHEDQIVRWSRTTNKMQVLDTMTGIQKEFEVTPLQAAAMFFVAITGYDDNIHGMYNHTGDMTRFGKHSPIP